MTLSMPKMGANAEPKKFISSARDFVLERMQVSQFKPATASQEFSQTELAALDRSQYASILEAERVGSPLTVLELDDIDTLARIRGALYADD